MICQKQSFQLNFSLEFAWLKQKSNISKLRKNGIFVIPNVLLKLATETCRFFLFSKIILTHASIWLREEQLKRFSYVQNSKYSAFMNQNVSFSSVFFFSTHFIHIASTYEYFHGISKNESPIAVALIKVHSYCVESFFMLIVVDGKVCL